MRIRCPDCEATYHFASSLIPRRGYDARCVHCHAAFFVKPDDNADTEPTVAVACPQCETRYRVSVDDIPSGGYDAQCHQCQSVFLVDRTPTSVELMGESDNEPRFSGLPTLDSGPEQSTVKIRLRDDERQALRGEHHESFETNVSGPVLLSDTEAYPMESRAL